MSLIELAAHKAKISLTSLVTPNVRCFPRCCGMRTIFYFGSALACVCARVCVCCVCVPVCLSPFCYPSSLWYCYLVDFGGTSVCVSTVISSFIIGGSVHLSVRQSIRMSIHPWVHHACLFVTDNDQKNIRNHLESLSTGFLSRLSVCLSVFLSLSLCLSLILTLSVCLCVCVCVCMCVCVR